MTTLTATGNPVTIKSISKGFWPNSLIIVWGDGDGYWSCVSATDSIALSDTVKTSPPVL